ncbi:SDR family oxidoreductase, partial [bacterium]|nr:SDR family oxidoreductase [bacterium]
ALTAELLPLMGRGSHVVNIGSMGGFQGSMKFAGLSYYSATKGALAILTECLAAEYADRGISFNCLCPGAVQTEMFSQAFPGFSAPVSPAEMAGYIADFAVNGNRFFNGKILPVALSVP